MSGVNILGAASISPQAIVSQQLPTTESMTYLVGLGKSVKISTASLCNVSNNLTPTVTASSLVAGVSAPTITLGTTNTSGGTFSAATYYWKVTTTTAFGETAGSNEITATLVANGTQVINWTAVTNALGYKVYRGTTAGSENILVTTISSGATVTYTDTGIAGTSVAVPTSPTSGTYYWKVTARSANGESLPSNELSATVTAIQAQPFTWPAVPGATSYNIYRGTAAGAENILVGNVVSPAYTDIGLFGTAATLPVTSAFSVPVPVYLSIVPVGGTVGDGTHRIINNYSLAPNDTLSLNDILGGAMLGPNDGIAAYAGNANSVTFVLTGTVHA